MLIITTVSIIFTIDENGIVMRAKLAKENTRAAEIQEIINFAIKENEIVKNSEGELNTKEELIQELVKSEKITLEESEKLYLNTLKLGEITIDISGLSEEENIIPTENSEVKEKIGEKGFVGYYADIENDGIVDGIIYADLAVAANGKWGNWGPFSYNIRNNLKKYKISTRTYKEQEQLGIYKENEIMGEKQVIVPVNSNGNERFYVMGLKDIVLDEQNTGTAIWSWYFNGVGKLDESMNTPISGDETNDFGKGIIKTEEMIAKWNNGEITKNDMDIWSLFTNENNSTGKIDSKKWFVPSRGEWGAFSINLKINKTNYEEMGLSTWYWTSSQKDIRNAFRANFQGTSIYDYGVNGKGSVRLSTVF